MKDPKTLIAQHAAFVFDLDGTLLKQLRVRGCRLGVCTNKIESAATRALERHNLSALPSRRSVLRLLRDLPLAAL